jgi:Holliday junction resolvase RusA-like endonuclease
MRPISVNKMYRTFRGRTIKSKEGRAFEVEFNHYLGEFAHHAVDFLSAFDQEVDALHVEVVVYIRAEDYFTKSGRMSKRVLDADNALKCVLDQIFDFIKIDDGLVTRVSSTKVPSEGDSVEIVVRKVAQPRKLLNPEPRAILGGDQLQ